MSLRALLTQYFRQTVGRKKPVSLALAAGRQLTSHWPVSEAQRQRDGLAEHDQYRYRDGFQLLNGLWTPSEPPVPDRTAAGLQRPHLGRHQRRRLFRHRLDLAQDLPALRWRLGGVVGAPGVVCRLLALTHDDLVLDVGDVAFLCLLRALCDPLGERSVGDEVRTIDGRHNHQRDNDKVESDRTYPTAGTEEKASERCHDDHEHRDKAHLPGLREPLTREHDQAHGALIDVDGGLD